MIDALVSTLTIEPRRQPTFDTHPLASRLRDKRDQTLPHLPCPSLEELGGAYDPYRHPAYEAMLTVADQIVKEYRSDWEHDLRTLARTDPATPFVWGARTGGTVLYTAATVREAVMAGWKQTFHRIPVESVLPPHLWYIWTGAQFRQVMPGAASLALEDWQQVLFPAAVA